MHLDSSTPLKLPLEDDPCDVIAKAMHGHDLDPLKLAQLCQLPIETVQQALRAGAPTINAAALESISDKLHLNSRALQSLPDYRPQVSLPPQLTQIVTPFGHAGVNAYLIQHGSNATLFDTGTDAAPLLKFLDQHQLTLDATYLTHGHHDHVGELDALPPYLPRYFAEDLPHGSSRKLAPGITLTSLDTSGHYSPSRAYFIDGLSHPICICGDIVFAGSMGKAPNSKLYQQSIQLARSHLMTLPADTLLCPGHGPITSASLEAQHNPFLSTRL